MPKYWLVVGTPANYQITARLGWTVQGFKSRHARKAAAMRPGDILIYYLTQLQVFAGTVRVTSPCFESHEPLWISEGRPTEDYPWRVKVAPEILLQPDGYLPAAKLAPQLAHVRKWPAANWTLAFQGNVHLLPEEDGRFLEDRIRQAAGSHS